jgi:hypothetical protein
VATADEVQPHALAEIEETLGAAGHVGKSWRTMTWDREPDRNQWPARSMRQRRGAKQGACVSSLRSAPCAEIRGPRPPAPSGPSARPAPERAGVNSFPSPERTRCPGTRDALLVRGQCPPQWIRIDERR